MTFADTLDLATRAGSGSDRALLASDWAAGWKRDVATDPAEAQRRLRGTLLALADRQEPLIDLLPYPESVRSLVRREFTRIRACANRQGGTALTLEDHSVRCDLRILCFGRIPTGVEHIELGGVPRSYLWRGSLGQAATFARCLWRAGGTYPFYRSHFMHGVKPAAFLLVCNRDTFTAWHRNVAGCLRLNPHIRGLFASSWWYDPAIARVSPHLAFLREESVAHGGVLLRYGPTSGAKEMSVANSSQRRELVERGEYRPEIYGIVWPRARLLAWAEN
jgi:hypothetical protein